MAEVYLFFYTTHGVNYMYLQTKSHPHGRCLGGHDMYIPNTDRIRILFHSSLTLLV